MSMEGYTGWCIKYPWHVAMEPYPVDKKGNCTCDCEYCQRDGVHKHKPIKIKGG